MSQTRIRKSRRRRCRTELGAAIAVPGGADLSGVDRLLAEIDRLLEVT